MEKKRNQTIKGFIHKASGKVSAIAFLEAQKEFLSSAELAPITSPILSKVDLGEIMPSAAVTELTQALFRFSNEQNELAIKGKPVASVTGIKVSKPRVSRKLAAHTATVYEADGSIAKHLNAQKELVETVKDFDLSQDAEGWSLRRLFDAAPHTYAVIVSHRLKHSDGTCFTLRIERGEALSRLLKAKGSPVLKAAPKGNGKLGFGVKAKQSRATFSGG